MFAFSVPMHCDYSSAFSHVGGFRESIVDEYNGLHTNKLRRKILWILKTAHTRSQIRKSLFSSAVTVSRDDSFSELLFFFSAVALAPRNDPPSYSWFLSFSSRCRGGPESRSARQLSFTFFIQRVLSPSSQGLFNTQAAISLSRVKRCVSWRRPPTLVRWLLYPFIFFLTLFFCVFRRGWWMRFDPSRLSAGCCQLTHFFTACSAKSRAWRFDLWNWWAQGG